MIVGVRPDGTKELVAVTDGHREDTESWLDVLRDLRDRNMRAPELAVGGGALEFWAALGQVFGSTRVQRCWVHYADLRIMPRSSTNVLVNAMRRQLVGIIHGL